MSVPKSEETVPETYIDTKESLEAFFDRLSTEHSHRECAVDTEADSMHSYETKLCLIQFAVPGELAIIDPLSPDIGSLDPLLDYLKGREIVWMHGADYDMSMFRMTFDWVPVRVWDTQTAARLLGIPKYGLANLLESEFEVKLSKQSQKADWSKRPLSDKMLAYAYNDVRYLLELGNRYVDRLKENDRQEWFVESCDAARSSVLERDEKPSDLLWRINGWGKLNRRGLAYLKALWYWRDSECKELDRPAFKFLGNQEILDIAIKMDLGEKVNPPHYLRPPFVRRMLKALNEVNELSEDDYPVKYRKNKGQRLDIDENKFNEIRSFRDKVAEDLGIEPTLLGTRVILERLASQNLGEEERCDLLMEWQKNLLKPVL